jgi:hypothetical protein
MNRADRKAWASARTLADVGELTAQWLEGKIRSQPGYQANCGPEPETRGLIPVLAACNRAGFVTSCSQPGMALTREGREQRAAVQGFAWPGTAERLRVLSTRHRFMFQALTASRFTSYKTAIVVTRWGSDSCDSGCTWFGTRLSRRHIRDDWEGYGCTAAAAVLCEALQVTIAHPQWGRDNRLWPALAGRGWQGSR